MAKRFKTKRKISWKKLISAIAVVVILLGSIAGIRACTKDETKTISASAFSRGSLDENGEYVETNASLYTPEAIACRGLKIVPDFDAQFTYDVYYYDYQDNFVDKKLGFKKSYDEDYPLYIATHCRIVIHPNNSDGENNEISWLEVRSIAKKLTITVDKDQTYKYSDSIDLYDEKLVIVNKSFQPLGDSSPSSFDSKNLSEYTDAQYPVKITPAITVDGAYDKYDVYVYLEVNEARWPLVALFDSTGKVIKFEGNYVFDVVNAASVVKPCWVKMTIEIPELESYEGVHFMVSMPEQSDCHIFGYND